MREKLFILIKPGAEETKAGKIYDFVMIILIIASLVPLMFKQETQFLRIVDIITVSIFIIDYILRWITADMYFDKKGIKPFLKYPFSIMAIIDLLSILPSLLFIYKGLKALRLVRLVRALKVFRVLKSFRYSKNIALIMKVLKKERDALIAVCILAVGYIFIAALIIFQVEPNTFNTFFDALYWATISLTTVGYGDLYAVSSLGQCITMISAFIGIAIVALPASIITAGYMQELSNNKKE